jgi:hypothetical protein
MNFEYLDYLPNLSSDLERRAARSIEGIDLFHKKNDVYKIFDVDQELKIFFKDFFDLSIYNIRVQALYSDPIIHVDQNRVEAINYIISSGGHNVVTSFFDDDLNVLEEIAIEPKKWHKLKVDTKHSVKNITTPPRVAITIHIPIKK